MDEIDSRSQFDYVFVFRSHFYEWVLFETKS